MASNNSDNASASMVASDREQEDCNEVSSNGSALTSGSKTQQKRSMKFRAWSFQLTINANLLNFTTTQQKRKLLTELLSNRAAAEKPFSVTSISTFCNESQLSGEPDSNGLVSIEVYGYVQTKNATPISTMPRTRGRTAADAAGRPPRTRRRTAAVAADARPSAPRTRATPRTRGWS